MTGGLLPIPSHDLARAGVETLPAIIGRAAEAAAWRFIEFFAATIRNKNTRAAYAQAVAQFFAWCEEHRVKSLAEINPVLVAAYIEHHPLSPPTVKQHLAAIRMLFDFLVIGQIVPTNPAASVRGPKHVVHRGKTPVLKADQARLLLDSIKTDSVVGLRDRAIIGLMCYTFARVSAIGYTNGYFGYFPTIAAAAIGVYGAASASTWAEPGAGERMVDHAVVKIHEMLGQMTELPDDLKRDVYK